jgi:hypothetical protein
MTTKRKKNEDPSSPLPMRICACGCENEFQPTRSDQFHLNTKHYDFAYNHGPRKEKYAEEIDVTKRIRKNDRILAKYFKIFDKQIVNLNFTIIKAEGFNDGIFTRIVKIKKNDAEIIFHALYKFCYRLFKQGEISFIEIRKL